MVFGIFRLSGTNPLWTPRDTHGIQHGFLAHPRFSINMGYIKVTVIALVSLLLNSLVPLLFIPEPLVRSCLFPPAFLVLWGTKKESMMPIE
jgi:hypothetical protein